MTKQICVNLGIWFHVIMVYYNQILTNKYYRTNTTRTPQNYTGNSSRYTTLIEKRSGNSFFIERDSLLLPAIV